MIDQQNRFEGYQLKIRGNEQDLAIPFHQLSDKDSVFNNLITNQVYKIIDGDYGTPEILIL